MPVGQDYIDDLINSPREQLAVELKSWFDPRSEPGKAKIVRGCIALRNQDGGFLQVGFEDGSGTPLPAGAPADVRSEWNADELQGLISKHASQPFEVHLRFAERGGQEFPVLEVEPGVRSPVAAKKELADPNDPSRKLVKAHAVYVRSLASNGTVSTTEAKYGDWPDLVDRCFENREADVGRFLRRHLDRAQLRALGQEAGAAHDSLPAPEPPGAVRAEQFRRDGYWRFQQEQQKRGLLYLPRHGSWEAAVVVEGEVPPRPPDKDFLNLINASNPRYTGWPLWIDSRGLVKEDGSPDADAEPYVFEGGWEAFMHLLDGDSTRRLEFWRVEPTGRFYQYRALRDDLATGPHAPEPMTELDFALPILHTAQAIAVAIAFAKAMGAQPDGTTLHYAFRWDGLQGRELSDWARSSGNAARYGQVEPGHVSRQKEVLSLVSVPLDAPASVLGNYVREATAPLFASFAGLPLEPGVAEELTDRLLSRRL